MSAIDCPSDDQFVLLLQGQLDPSQLDAMHEHIEACASCAELVRHVALMITPRPPSASQKLIAPEALTLPTQIGRYRIKALLGLGGMGVVYRAFDPELERDVALKLLRPDLGLDAGRQAEVEARQLIEAKSLAMVEHPNVLPIFEVGAHEGRVYLVTQLVEGRTARAVALSGQLEWPQLVALYLQVARGLKAAHQRGVIHRDIKPDNIMVNADGHAFLTDFGLARSPSAPTLSPVTPFVLAQEPALRLRTMTGALVGTPAYMSPEQLDGQPATTRSDIYSWCVSLYEALYGFRPYSGQSVEALHVAASAGQLTRPSSALPPALFDALARGLRPRAAERYEDMDALILAIEAATSPARPPGLSSALKPWMLGLLIALIVSGVGLMLKRETPDAPSSPKRAQDQRAISQAKTLSAPSAPLKRLEPTAEPLPAPALATHETPATLKARAGSSASPPSPKRAQINASPVYKPQPAKASNTSSKPHTPSTSFTPPDPDEVSDLFEQVKEEIERSAPCLPSSTKLMAMVDGDPSPTLLRKSFVSLHAECLMLSGHCDEGVALIKRRLLPYELSHKIASRCLPTDTQDDEERWRRYTGRISFSCSFSLYSCHAQGPCRDTIREVNAALAAKAQPPLHNAALRRTLFKTLDSAISSCLDRQQECALAQDTFAVARALEAGQTHIPTPTLNAAQMSEYGKVAKKCSPMSADEQLKLAFEIGRLEQMANKAPYAQANAAAFALITSALLRNADEPSKLRVADAIDALVARQLKAKRPCPPLEALALQADNLRFGPERAQQAPHAQARTQRLTPACPTVASD